MRLSVALVILLLLAPLVPFVAPAAASASPLADAGYTQKVQIGGTISLVGHVEGFAGATSVSWSAPAACAIADPAALATTASCSAGGFHTFTLSATDGASTASDTVLQIVRSVAAVPLLTTTGEVLVGEGLTAPVKPFDTEPYAFTVPAGATALVATLLWTSPAPGIRDDLDLYLEGPESSSYAGESTLNPEVVNVMAPKAGDWTIVVSPYLVDRASWTLWVNATVASGDATLPGMSLPGGAADANGVVTMYSGVRAGEGTVEWELDPASRRFDDGVGANFSFPFAGSQLVRARLTTPEGFELERVAPVRARGELARPLTVVAVIDSSFSPYHYDFLGSQHPWNRDADATNDIDFNEHPAAYVAGITNVLPLSITLPDAANVDVNALRTGTDAETWASMARSNATSATAYWLPGTKVIAALKFSATFQADNAAHGTVSAAVAAGNVHGTCPECLFVLVQGSNDAALAWVAGQSWIDIVTNSYGAGSVVQANTAGYTRDNAYWKSPVDATRVASEDGLVIVFSAGNGFVNAFDVPMFTYWSSQKGPDWMVTVGAVDPDAKQTYSGAGKPADISSIGSAYPASGGATANGTGTHSGTSNAAPTTAGYFAKALQRARETLGDTTTGHSGGIIATGAPHACGAAVATCALGDGVLTRSELESAVYANVLPSDLAVAADTVWPSTQLNYYYQGHGVLRGLIDGPEVYEQEWRRIADHLHGDVAAYPRPAGEENWFLVDSKCRQRLWGAWNGGLWNGQAIALDPVDDPIATVYDAWCSAVPEKPFARLVATNRVP